MLTTVTSSEKADPKCKTPKDKSRAESSILMFYPKVLFLKLNPEHFIYYQELPNLRGKNEINHKEGKELSPLVSPMTTKTINRFRRSIMREKRADEAPLPKTCTLKCSTSWLLISQYGRSP